MKREDFGICVRRCYEHYFKLLPKYVIHLENNCIHSFYLGGWGRYAKGLDKIV